jgi:hypothetical protein
MFETIKSTSVSSSKPLMLLIGLGLIVCLVRFGWFVTRTLAEKGEEYKIHDGHQLVRVYDNDPSIDRALISSNDWRSVQGPDWKKKFQELRKSALLESKKMNLLPMYIDANDTGLSDDDLNSISFIPLGGLRACGTRISDKGLQSLKDETSLREIYLIRTKVTDTGLSNLANLPHLTYIFLDGTKVTDETIKLLSTCPEISTISLKFCKKVEGGSLESLARSQVYTGINLSYTSTAPRNLKKLRGLKLEGIDLAGLDLCDADLEAIAEIQNVKVLTVRDNPKITRKGLLKLIGMPNLETLFADPSIDFKEFKESRPDVRINPV